MLTVKNLSIEVNQKVVVDQVSFDLAPGQLQVLMGPNGAGKSSLAKALIGYPGYQPRAGSVIELDGQSLLDLDSAARFKRGLMLLFQEPAAIAGLKILDFLWAAYQESPAAVSDQSILDFKTDLEAKLAAVGLPTDTWQKSVNDGLSGGEKKRLELCQALLLQPKYLILDELDAGLDVDAIKTIGQVLAQLLVAGTGILLISHQFSLINQLPVAQVLVMTDGQIRARGEQELLTKIADDGYQSWLKKGRPAN